MAKNVLVLNDADNSLGELIQALQKAGYTAYSSDNADACIDLFDEIKPKALYMSLLTIGVLDSLQVIRMDPDGANITIAFLGTGKEGIKNDKAAKARGGDAFYKFPPDISSILGDTRKWIGAGEKDAPLPTLSGGEPPLEEAPPPTEEAVEPPPEETGAEETLAEAADQLLEEITEELPPAPEPEDSTVAKATAESAQEDEIVPLAEKIPKLEEPPSEKKPGAEAPSTTDSSATEDAATVSPATEDAAPDSPVTEDAAPDSTVTKAAAPDSTAIDSPATEDAAPDSTETDSTAIDSPAIEDAAPETSTESPESTSATETPPRESGTASTEGTPTTEPSAPTETAPSPKAEAQIQELKERLEKVQNELGVFKQLAEVAEQDLTSQKEQVEKLMEDVSTLESDKASLEEKRKEEETLRQVSHEALEESKKASIAIAEQLNDETKRREGLEKELEKSNQDIGKLRSEISNLQQHQSQLEHSQANTSDSLNKLRNSLEEEQARAQKSQKDAVDTIHFLKEEREKLTRELEDLHRDLNSKNESSRLREQQYSLEREKIITDIRKQTEDNIRNELVQQARYRSLYKELHPEWDGAPPDVILSDWRQVKTDISSHRHYANPATSSMTPLHGVPPVPGPSLPGQPERHPRPGDELTGTQLKAPVPSNGHLDGPNDIALLFTKFWWEQITGRIDFLRGSEQKVIYLQSGKPIDAYSNQPGDSLAHYLMRRGKLSRNQYLQAQPIPPRGTRTQAASLAEMGLLKPEELVACVSDHLREIVWSLFSWESGEFTYYFENPDGSELKTIPEDPRTLILEGIRRKYEYPRQTAVIGPSSTVMKWASGQPGTVPWLPSQFQDARILKRFDGKHTLSDIVLETGMPSDMIYPLAITLYTLGTLELRIRGTETSQVTMDPKIQSMEFSRIQNKLEEIRQADYFTILGLTPRATPFEIDAAFRQVMNDFSPTAFTPQTSEKEQGSMAEISRGIHEAYEVLKNDRLRMAYARNLPASQPSRH